MKGDLQHSLLILIFAVIAILARPCFVFASQSPNAPSNQQTNFDSKQVVRKRNEYGYNQEECTVLDDIRKKIGKLSINSSFSFLHKLHISLLLIRSYIFCGTNFFKVRTTVFQISPHNNYYISLSVFRI
jgi:hypothetical protein